MLISELENAYKRLKDPVVADIREKKNLRAN